MPGKIFLSPLKSKERLLPVPQPGRWHSQADFLATYSADIPLDGLVDDRQLVHSVPTVFARPIQFYQALENERHPAHASVVGQWRGLLAAIALQKWLNLSIRFDHFSLAKALGERTPAKNDGGADLPFLSILKSQLPKPEAEWERWWLLRCKGSLLGATSPWSLVYTAAEFHCPAEIPWRKQDRLIDPLDWFGRAALEGSDELALLASWLDQVLKGERERWGVAERKDLEPAMRTLVRELRAWQVDLASFQQERFARRPLIDGGMVGDDPYRHFLRAIDTEGIIPASDLVLDSDSGVKTIVLSKLGLDSRKRVYGPVLAGQIDVESLPGPLGEAGWKAPSGRQIPWPYVIAEEAFFPPKLAEIPLSEEALAAGNKGFALPLTPLFFRFFSLASLLEKGILQEMTADEQRVTARLKLPLSGGGHLLVERQYNRKTDVVRSDAPALAFWPDFVDPDWHHNLGLLSGPRQTDLTVAPLVEGGSTLETSAADGSEETFRIWGSTRPLLGFALLHSTAAGTSDAGVVVRNSLPRAQARKGSPWRVGVDFGTSSTNLLLDDGTGSGPRPLILQRRTVVLTRAASGFEAEVRRKVYPTEDVRPPFPTLLFRNDGTLVESEGVIPMRQDLYTPRFVLFQEDFFYGGSYQPVKNLKWAGRGDSEIPLREYLTALVRAVACEARAAGAESLRFEWSYPLSLPSRTKTSMTAFWQTTAKSFSIPEVLDVQAETGISESEANCRHLASLLPVRAESLSVAVDIGGGSTDIGFWTEGRLLGQVSLKLAGNDVLEPLVEAQALGFFSALLSICDPARPIENLQIGHVMENPAIPLNVFLAQAVDARGQRFSGDPREHPVPVALATIVEAGLPPWSVARTLIYLFAGGITFYLGLHSRKWMEGIGIKAANIRFGGRGAALLTWVARDQRLEELLRSVFLEGLTLDKEVLRGVTVGIHAPGISYDPRSPLKGEVAQGLVSPPLSDERPDRATKTLVGEIGWRDQAGEPLAWDAEIGAAQLELLKPPPNHDSGYMAYFLNRVVARHADDLSLDLAGLKALRLDSAKVHHQLRQGLAEDQEVLQPVFAVELKVLMEDYLRKAGAANV